MVFDPTGAQPLMPYFDIELDGLSQIYMGPDIPVEIDVTMSVKNHIGEIEFNLYDNTGYDVEPSVWTARDPQTGVSGGSFQFGYLGDINISSERFNFQISEYKPVYVKNAFTVNIFGNFCLTPAITSYQYSGTVEEVINKIAQNHNLTAQIDPPFATDQMQGQLTVSHQTTSKRQLVSSKFTSESDWRYLCRILKTAISQDNKTGYYPYITCKGGQNILKITMPKSGSSSQQQYFIQAGVPSIVHDWQFSFNFAHVLGAWNSDSHGSQVGTRYPTKHALYNDNTKIFHPMNPQDMTNVPQINAVPKVDTPSKVFMSNPELMEPTTPVRTRYHGRNDPWVGLTQGGLAAHIQKWQLNASLTVLGDPTLQPDFFCDVYFYYPLNYKNNSTRILHYSSGTYYVHTVIHSIRAGQYLTTLKMERAAIDNLPAALQAGGGP